MMATGYTHPVIEGEITELKDFAMLCARAFGACITMRDESLDTKIPDEFTPSTQYYDDEIETTIVEIDMLSALDPSKYEELAQAAYDESYAEYLKSQEDSKRENAALDLMMEKVKKWTPSEDLIGLKKFMIEQLDISGNRYHLTAPKRQTGDEWFKNELEYKCDHLKHCTESRNKEIERTKQRNEWIRKLRTELEKI